MDYGITQYDTPKQNPPTHQGVAAWTWQWQCFDILGQHCTPDHPGHPDTQPLPCDWYYVKHHPQEVEL